jgi:hypothetical protein
LEDDEGAMAATEKMRGGSAKKVISLLRPVPAVESNSRRKVTLPSMTGMRKTRVVSLSEMMDCP